MTSPPSQPHPITDPNAARDLGFGTRVAGYSRLRLRNKDGSINVRRKGLGAGTVLSPYHALLSMPWHQFLCLVIAFFVAVNTVFALLYVACGPDALAGPVVDHISAPWNVVLRAFFFSVETFGTIGYGNIVPVSLSANLIMTTESLTGLIALSLTTGLVFARFSRPTARIVYSQNAVVAPYRGISAFMFRCANARNNQLIDVSVRVLFSRLEERDGVRTRQFTVLPLEFEHVTFFTLSWTIVHPIDDNSPLIGYTHQDLIDNDAEFLILLSGLDETFAQTVHSKTSYKGEELVWGAKYTSIFVESVKSGVSGMDLSRIHDYQPADLPSAPTT